MAGTSEPPLFCCCQFIDRHGKTAHLLDLSCCDQVPNRCCSGQAAQVLTELLSDLDDRLRLPQYNGAVYLGIEGIIPVVTLPLLASIAQGGPVRTVALLLLLPVLLSVMHHQALRRRRRSRFFVTWCGASLVYGHGAFTLIVAEHVHFAWWLGTTILHVLAFFSASSAREPPPPAEIAPVAEAPGEGEVVALAADCSDGAGSAESDDPSSTGAATSQGDAPKASTAQERGVYCPLCGVLVPGYDHHCIWLDACIGAHNRSYFLRGIVFSLVAMSAQTAITAQRGIGRGRWCIELVLASYGAVLVAAAASLLLQQTWLLAHGITAYEAKMHRRRGTRLPPFVGTAAFLREVGRALSG